MPSVDRYTYRVWWSDADDSFLADVVELDGVLAFGTTTGEALENAQGVAAVWLEDAATSGRTVPVARGHIEWVARELAVLANEPVTADDVRVVRQNLGLTQRAFADLLGVALNTVQAWEQGGNTPNGASQHLIRLIDAIARRPELPHEARSREPITA
ncbi:MAG: helix-turn-helix domain-containing protein [Chloroflexia bacterium]|nr:helix-turn-helix domain-containing protein [Chloroflexia bacterium]